MCIYIYICTHTHTYTVKKKQSQWEGPDADKLARCVWSSCTWRWDVAPAPCGMCSSRSARRWPCGLRVMPTCRNWAFSWCLWAEIMICFTEWWFQYMYMYVCWIESIMILLVHIYIYTYIHTYSATFGMWDGDPQWLMPTKDPSFAVARMAQNSLFWRRQCVPGQTWPFSTWQWKIYEDLSCLEDSLLPCPCFR